MAEDPEDELPWTCDECGEPILRDQLVYTIADNREKRTGRHGRCQDKRQATAQADYDKAMANIRSSFAKIRDLLRK